MTPTPSPTWRPGRAAGAIVLVALQLCATAPAKADGPTGWTEARTDHFRVLGNDSSERVRSVAERAENLLSALDQLAPIAAADDLEPITFLAFGSNESFYEFAGSTAVVDAEAGFLIAHRHGLYAAFVTGENPTRQIQRQVIRYLVESRYPGLPQWLGQGVAEIYATARFEAQEIHLGLPVSTHLMFLNSSASRESWQQVVSADREEAATISGFNIRSWALAHYLLLGNRNLSDRLGTYLDLLTDLERPHRAFHTAFGTSPEELGALIDAYLREDSLPFARVRLELLPPVSASSRVLSETEVILALVDHAIHTKRGSLHSILGTLHEIARGDPTLPKVWTLTGEVQAALDNPAEAAAALRKAVALDPSAFKAHLLLGEVLLNQARGRLEEFRPPDPDAASEHESESSFDEPIAVLERALELRPDSFAALENLSYAYASVAEPSTRAIEAVEKAVRLLPSRFDLVFNLLLMRAKLGDIDEVQELLGRLAALGAEEYRVTAAREMLLQLRLKATRELMLGNRLDDAIGVLSEVQARTTNDQLRATALDWIGSVKAAQQHQLFVEHYNEAVRAYNAGEWSRAIAALDELGAVARSGEQELAVGRLRREVEYWRD